MRLRLYCKAKLSAGFFLIGMLCFSPLGAQQTSTAASPENAPDSVETACLQHLKALEESGDLTAWLGMQRNLAVHRMGMNHPFEALAGIDRALQGMQRPPVYQEEYRALSALYMYKSWIAKQVGDFQMVKTTLEQALDNFNKHLKSALPKHAEYIYLQLGNADARLGEFEGARQVFETAIAYSLEFHAPNVAKYNDYGTIYQSQGLDSIALSIFKKGEKHPGLDAYQRTLLRLNEAECLAKMGRLAEARAANTIASGMITREMNPDQEGYWRCRYGLEENNAILAEKSNRAGEAIAWYRKARNSALELPDLEARIPAGFDLSAAQIFLNLAQPDSALALCARATQALLPAEKIQSGQLLTPDQLYAENLLIRMLQIQAESFMALQNPERALAAYELIPGVEKALRANHDYERSSLLALASSRQRFDRAIAIAWQLYERSGDQQFAFRAFDLSEHARGLLLLESLARAQADFKLPDQLGKQENAYKVQIAWYEQQLAQMPGTANNADRKLLESQLFELKRQFDGFRRQLQQEIPGYAGLFAEPPLLRAGEVPRMLSDKRILLSYYLDDRSAYIFRFGPGPNFSWRKAELPTAFRDSVQWFAGFLSRIDESTADSRPFSRLAYRYYDLLAAPELENAAAGCSLVIIPDDVLSFIPFEVLLRHEASGLWPKMPYLLRDFPISYTYSATLLQMQERITATARPNRALFAGFAPAYPKALAEQPVPDMRDGMYDLKGTHEELHRVQALIGGDAFDGKQATEALFKRIAGNYRILMLSMHGLADEENPALSRLLFGGAGPSDGEDNILYAAELQIMHLQADLVVLSACHTGFGKWHKGEGVYSLARALAAAGVPATVMSLWRLPDATAPILMENFFKNLKAGMAKDEALRRAKLDFLDKPANFELSHPGFWAGIVANGDMSPLNMGTSRWWWFAGVLLLIAGAGWFLWRRKRVIGKN